MCSGPQNQMPFNMEYDDSLEWPFHHMPVTVTPTPLSSPLGRETSPIITFKEFQCPNSM